MQFKVERTMWVATYYYSQYLIEYLPLIQKITFVLVLTWVIGLNILIKNKKHTTTKFIQNTG